MYIANVVSINVIIFNIIFTMVGTKSVNNTISLNAVSIFFFFFFSSGG